MSVKNTEIRTATREAGLHLWQVAEAYGVADTKFSKLLRRELPPERKAEILKVIFDLKRKEG